MLQDTDSSAKANFLTNAFLRLTVAWVGGKFPETPTITTDEVSRMPEEHIVVIDCRSQAEFRVSRIRGAKHVKFLAEAEEILREVEANVTGKESEDRKEGTDLISTQPRPN